MVKTVLGVNHQGLRDWIIQRLSAIFMAIYCIAMIGYFLTHQDLEFASWQLLFSQVWMKVATLLFIALLLMHAWVGMWTVFTDYIKPYVLSLMLNGLVLVGLVASFFWALLIVWGV